jgi:hypothetical protein
MVDAGQEVSLNTMEDEFHKAVPFNRHIWDVFLGRHTWCSHAGVGTCRNTCLDSFIPGPDLKVCVSIEKEGFFQVL